MSFGIKVNNIFLDLKPGTSAEIERKSPFFAITDLTSEVSTPITILYSAKNDEALGLNFHFYQQRKKIKVPAELYDGTEFKNRCTLVVEAGSLNVSRVEDSELTGYVLFGISDFFQLIKDKKLNELSLGGARTFQWTTNNPNDGSAGYWQHFHRTWTDDSIPYVCAPVRNEGYIAEGSAVVWMNKLGNDGRLAYDFTNPIVPFVKLKYLLTQIFSEHGFSVVFAGISDNQWEKLVLTNLKRIDWVTPIPQVGPGGVITYTGSPFPSITFGLGSHMPDGLISDFIFQLFRRYGWAPVFDVMRRTVRIVAVKELGNTAIKDWTAFAEPVLKTSFNEEAKVFEFKNQIDSNDSYPSAPDFTNLQFNLPAYTIRYLPNPTAGMEGRLVYCFLENQWYQAQFDTAVNAFRWKFFADNIYDDSPAKANSTIDTTISTLPVQLTQYRTVGSINYFGFFPIMKQPFNKPAGYRLLIYQGMVQELTDIGAAGPQKYPYASSLRHDPLGTSALTWSNVYRHKQFPGTPFEVDYGIVKYWWESFLKTLNSGEETEFKLHLPRHLLPSLKWDERILIANQLFLLKSVIEPVPYKGYVVAKMKRLITDRPKPVTTVGGVVVYARLTVENIRLWFSVPAFNMVFYQADIRVSFFSDSAGVVLYHPTQPIHVHVFQEYFVNGNSQGITQLTYIAQAQTQIVTSSDGHIVTQNGITIRHLTFALAPSPTGQYNVI